MAGLVANPQVHGYSVSNMTYKLLLIFLWIAIGAATPGFTQTKLQSTTSTKATRLYLKADEYMKARDFDRALAMLSEAISKDTTFAEAYLKAATLHKIMGNKAAAFEHLRQGVQLLPYNPALATYYFDLAELYFDQGLYAQAKTYYHDFLRASPQKATLVNRARQQVKSVEFALKAMQQPVPFHPVIMPASINQFRMQYFPYTTADQRFFIYTARVSTGTEQQEDIFISEQKEGVWQLPVSISDAINSPANEGAATISGDAKTLVFTSCNRRDNQSNCDLYISYRTGNEWSQPKNMGTAVNSKAWDSQPSLSADGRTLYFSSTRGGGLGKEDIWRTQLNDDGSWQNPVNVGAPLNTAGRDMAPFIHASGTALYLVSDGRVGMGGLDVYKALKQAGGTWSEPENLGYPLNTQADEGSLFISADNQKGYYSRTEVLQDGSASIQLYTFSVPHVWKSNRSSTYAQGRVLDAETKKPVHAQVQLYNVNVDSLVQQVASDKVSGEYTIVLTEGQPYALYVSAPGYLLKSLHFDYSSPKALQPVALDVYLAPLQTGAAVVLHNLFFNTGKYTLAQPSKTELSKLLVFLRQNKLVQLQITGHTDDVGSEKDNLILSEKRAQAVVDYLASNGISKSRLRYKGYGESKPLKPNTSEENRQQNRRIEMQVVDVL